jgi:hypothetical protein
MHPVHSPSSFGTAAARELREKLQRGMPLERAWQELTFEWHDEVYVLSLLPGELLRVEAHPEMDDRDWWQPPTPWVGKY